jgi:hypothetical protein
MIGFIGTSITITTNYNSSQLMTAHDSLHSLLDYECLLICRGWLGSDLRIGHFFSFRCPLVSTPQPNSELLTNEWRLLYDWIVLLCTAPYIVYRKPWKTSVVTETCLVRSTSVRCCGNVCLGSRWLAMDVRSASTIQAFRRHVTIFIKWDLVQNT